MRPAIFEIASAFSDGPGLPEEQIRLSAEGEAGREAGAFVLRYREETEGGALLCVLRLFGDGSASVERDGAVTARFFLEVGARRAGRYEVPPCRFPTEVEAVRIFHEERPEGGEVSLGYRLTIGGADRFCRLSLSYRYC